MLEGRYRLGMEGLDPVALLGQHRKVLGNPRHRVIRKGQMYFFVNQDNLNVFQGSPEVYLPQFDGNCGFLYSTVGKIRPGVPSSAHSIEGKFYFFSRPFWGQICRHLPWLLEEGHRRFEEISVNEAEGGLWKNLGRQLRESPGRLWGRRRPSGRVRPGSRRRSGAGSGDLAWSRQRPSRLD